MSLHLYFGLLCGTLSLLNLAQVSAAEAPQPWSGDLAAQQKAAAQDGKPVVVLVRNPFDVGTIDAGHWVAEDAASRKAADGFHAAMLWNFEPEVRALLGKPDSGFLFLTSKGQLIVTEAVPDLRADLPAVFDAVRKWPVSADDLAKAAVADPQDLDRSARAIKVLVSVGRADHAQQLFKLAVPQGQQAPAHLAAEAENLGWLAPLHSGQRLETLAELFSKFVKADKPEVRPGAEEMRLGLEAVAASALYGTPEDEALVRDAKASGGDLVALAKNPADADAEKGLKQRLSALAGQAQTRAEQLKNQARDLRRAAGGGEKSLAAQLMALFERQQPKDEGKVRELLGKLLAAPLDGKEVRRSLGAAVYAVQWLDLIDERATLMKRVVKELPTGRAPADILLDLADMAYEDGKTDEAQDYWNAAIKAAEGGESPTLWRAAKAARALALGEDSPRRSNWAKREIVDVLVLVPDIETFAAAISQWEPDRFFPVLFQDDLYAPKFAATFKPAKTIWLPSVRNKTNKEEYVFSAVDIRRAILASWTANDKMKDLPTSPSEDELRARRKAVGGDPQGVVFGDASSGETPGALALAAGRFQGFVVLPRPTVGKDEQERRLSQPNDFLGQPAAWDMAKSVREGLARWDLPYENRWAAVTLAGAYPYRYSGLAWDRWGTTYALDDLLGRDEDGTRVAAVSRLLGNYYCSAYQAMCSLFLTPESAFLFNTYGLNLHSIWGFYRTDFAEAAWKDRFKVTQFNGEKANVESFRGNAIPWNREGLIVINSSGGAHEWSVSGGGGTPDDFPVGVPAAIHVTHSGTAAAVYDTDTLAGRAIWGGAYWYFGSTAEPFLTAFQPSRYFAPRLANGAPFSATFRQRSAQNFYLPWRLMMVGDPLFCLRERIPERKPYAAEKATFAGAVEVSGTTAVTFDDPAGSLPSWKGRLRRSRWCGDRAAASTVVKQWPKDVVPDGEALALLLEEDLLAGDTAGAEARWTAAAADAKKAYAARIYARYAIASLMDKALESKDGALVLAHFSAMLTTGPARNFTDRWLDKLVPLSTEKKEEAAYMTWLNDRSADAALADYKASFAMRINRLKTDALLKKDKWTAEDKKEAFANLVELLRAEKDANKTTAAIEALGDACQAKLDPAAAGDFAKEVLGLVPQESDQAKALKGVLEAYASKRTLFKDWMLLGAFTVPETGAFEKVAPQGKADFAAVFKEGEREIKWTRPFKPNEFGIVDLAAALKPNENCFAYAAAALTVDKDADGTLMIGSDDGVTVWLDGKEIHKNPAQRGVRIDEDKVKVKFAAGTHTLLVRIDQGGGGWGFCLRVADKAGNAALKGATLSCPAK